VINQLIGKEKLMFKKSVFCTAASQDEAEIIVERLAGAGLTNSDVSALFPDTGRVKALAHERNIRISDKVAAATGLRGLAGVSLTWLADLEEVSVPRIGQVVAAGPVAAQFDPSSESTVANALVGSGMPESEARRYEGKVEEGKIFILVQTLTGERADRAKDIFAEAGARDIATSAQQSPDPVTFPAGS
jgi:hypothetical protein